MLLYYDKIKGDLDHRLVSQNEVTKTKLRTALADYLQLYIFII